MMGWCWIKSCQIRVNFWLPASKGWSTYAVYVADFPQKEPEPPSECPMSAAQDQQASMSECPSNPTFVKDPNPAEIDPLNMMPPPNQRPSPDQPFALPTDRQKSSIPKVRKQEQICNLYVNVVIQWPSPIRPFLDILKNSRKISKKLKNPPRNFNWVKISKRMRNHPKLGIVGHFLASSGAHKKPFGKTPPQNSSKIPVKVKPKCQRKPSKTAWGEMAEKCS